MEQSKIIEIFDEIRDFHSLKFDLKEKQIECLLALANKESVAAILPTGYGKSIIYTILPKILDKVCTI